MLAVSESKIVEITQNLPLSDPIWVWRKEILGRIIPPTECLYELVRWYYGTPRFVRAHNALKPLALHLYEATATLISETMVNADHQCLDGQLSVGGILFLVFHLKIVRPSLLCLPELILPSFPITDYLSILEAVGGASVMSKSALTLPDKAANWGGINWRILEGLTISTTAPPRLVRMPESYPVCKPTTD